MKRIKPILLFVICLCMAVTTFACTGKPTVDINGNEVVIDFKNISEVSVLNPEQLESEGFLLSSFKLSDVSVHIVYGENGSVDIPLTSAMVKAASQAKLSVAGVHTIECSYGGKFDFSFVLRLYTSVKTMYEVTFYDESGENVVGTRTLEEGATVTPPQMPTKEGYTLVGWKNKSTGVMVTDFTVRSNVSYVSVYQPDYYEVRFYYTVGEKSTLIKTATVARGGNALDVAPEIPIVSGYSNRRWSNEEAMKSVGENNTDFYAVYDSDKVLITFSYYKYTEGVYYDYDVSWSVDLATEGVTPPDDAERLEDNVFLYWYVERNGEEIKTTFPYKVTGEMKFTAKYVSFADGTPELEYKLDDEGTGYIVTGLKADSDAETVVIPSYYLGLPVKSVENGAFSYASVKKFAVSDDNRYFRANDGALYAVNANEITLAAYPVAAERTSFTPDTRTREIAAYAFRGANNLEEIILPQSLTEIGAGAFSECENLAEVALPENVQTISDELFKNSRSLVSVTLGSRVTEIGDEAFCGAASLTAIVLPASLVRLGENVFIGCGELASITVSGTNSSVNSGFTVYGGALYGYREGGTNPYAYLYAYPAKYLGVNGSAEFTVNSDVQVIKKGAFYGAAIEGIYVGTSSIEFEENSVVCPLLVSIRFGATKVNMPEETFGGYKPEVIYVTNETSFGGSDTFGIRVENYSGTGSPYKSFVGGFAYEVDETTKKVTVTAYKGNSSVLTIPSEINSFAVAEIRDGVFMNNSSIREVVFPDTLEVIGADAFAYCNNLKKVIFGKNVRKIGENAFADCGESVEFVSGEAKITEVGDNAFGNYAIDPDENGVIVIGGVVVGYVGYEKTVIVPENVTIIAERAFVSARFVSAIDFSSAIELIEIKEEAFSGLEEITRVDFPNALRIIGEKAFFGCVRLKEINGTPESGVASSAFDECGTERNDCWEVRNGVLRRYRGTATCVVLPSGITEIADNAFKGNSYVETVVFPDELTVVGNSSFENCVNLKTVIINAKLTAIGAKAFSGCERLSAIDFSSANGLADIASDAFEATEWLTRYPDDSVIVNGIFYKYLGQLEDLHIPNSVKAINEKAFYGAAVKTLYIPESVRIIGDYAFANSDISKFNFGLRNVSVEIIGEGAFEGCTSLAFLDLGNMSKLKTIGQRAFFGAKSLDDGKSEMHVYLPASVTSIGESAFENSGIITVRMAAGSKLETIERRTFFGCELLTSVIFEGKSSLTSVSESAFENCVALKVFHNAQGNVYSLGERAFFGATALENFKINEESLTEVGRDCFFGNKFIGDNEDKMVFVGTALVKYNGKLDSTVLIPAKTTAIGNSAFANNAYIETVAFITDGGKTNIKEIQESAFENCVSLRSVKLPDSVTTIGQNAFASCKALAKIELGNGVTDIGKGAFSSCVNLREITITSSVVNFDGSAFNGCSSLKDIKTEGNTKFSSIDGAVYEYRTTRNGDEQIRNAKLVAYPNGLATESGDYAVPERITVNGTSYAVDGIGDYAFSGCDKKVVSRILLHSGIASLGQYAFEETEAAVVFADDATITEISDYVFAKYEGAEIKIPESVTRIGKHAFESAKNVSVLDIPAAVAEIGEYAFSDMGAEIKWNANCAIKSVSDYGFAGYYGTKLTIPNTVVGIGRYAFSDITADLTLPTGLTEIGEYAFYGYRGKNAPEIPASVLSIGDYAFAHMTEITGEIKLNSAIESVGAYAFEGVSAPVKIADGSKLTEIGEYAFAGYLGDKVDIPSGVARIAAYAFYGCENLTSVGGLNNVTIIGEYAFAYSKINSFVAHDELYSIGARAFYSCEELTEIRFGKTSGITNVGQGAFEGCSTLIEADFSFVGGSIGSGNGYIGYVFGGKNYSDNARVVPTSLKTVTVHGGVIDANAFYGCSSVEKITVDEEVLNVKEGAFVGCTGLSEISLPYGGVFGLLFGGDKYSNNKSYVPTSLKNVELKKITELSDNAFYECINVKTVVLPESLTSIGTAAFYGCSALEKANVGANVSKIGANAFARCSSMKKIEVDRNNAAYVGDDGVLYAYGKDSTGKNVARLMSYPQKRTATEYEIGLNVNGTDYEITAIDGYAFYYTSLKKVIFPESLKSIGEYAFAYSSISEITLPSATESIIQNAFTDCSSLKKVYIDNANMLIAQTDVYRIFAKANEIYVLNELSDSVRESTYIYKNFVKLVSSATNDDVVIRNDGKDYAVFYRSGAVTPLGVDITFDSKAAKVYVNGKEYGGRNTYLVGTELNLKAEPKDGYVFVGWFVNDELLSGDREIDYTIENRNVSLSARFVYVQGTQSDWTVEETASLGEGTTYYVVSAKSGEEMSTHKILLFVGNGALTYKSANYPSHKNYITSLIVGDGITSIENGAFEEFTSLTDASLPKTLTAMGERAFAGCIKLENINLPDRLSKVSVSAFENCVALAEVTFGKETASIETNAFKNTAVVSVALPFTIKSVDYRAFDGAKSLKSFEIDTNKKSAQQGGDIAYVADGGALYALNTTNKEATLVIVPLTTYGKFSIPEKVERRCVDYEVVAIGNGAMTGCEEITSVVIPSTVLTIGNEAFNASGIEAIEMSDNGKYVAIDNVLYSYLTTEQGKKEATVIYNASKTTPPETVTINNEEYTVTNR